MNTKRIAITHASNLLAEPLLTMMVQSGIQPESVVLLDVEELAGNRLAYGDTYITVLDQSAYDYEDLAAVLLLQADAELQDLLQHADCYVISHFEDETPSVEFFTEMADIQALSAPPAMIKLASAELSTLAFILRPLSRVLELNALQVVNVLSASMFGKSGVDELASQTIELLNGRDISASVFPLQLAFNMIPQTTDLKQASRLVAIMGNPDLSCSIQSIVVPAFHGLSMAVVLESKQVINMDEVKQVLVSIPSVVLAEALVSPHTHCKDENKIIIFAVNQPQNDAKRLQFWIMSDSVRNGLINNYHNLMEILLNSHL